MNNMIRYTHLLLTIAMLGTACKKSSGGGDTPVTPPVSPPAGEMMLVTKKVNDQNAGASLTQLQSNTAVLRLTFSAKIDRNTVAGNVTWTDMNTNSGIPVSIGYDNGDSVLIVQPKSTLGFLNSYSAVVSNSIKSTKAVALSDAITIPIRTGLDTTNKFPVVSDDALLTLVQQQTFKYFWDFGHPVSGLARDKTNDDNEDCAIGGTGFGLLCIPAAVNRHFISRADGLARMQKVVGFLKTKATAFHGAFAHRVNGTTGAVIVWEPGDDGADIVETSFMMMGLLTNRQYFNGTDPNEIALRNDINTLYNNVDWNWFQQNGQNALFWLWSPTGNWDKTFMVRGWNEALIVYILAASSPTHPINRAVYDNGYANNGGIKNGQQYYGYTLPLGDAMGGPLFLSQYTFMVVNPNGLSDAYGNYELQTKNQALINRAYCMDNPKKYFGYSDSFWGLSACSSNTGYVQCSPTNDIGVVAPTAALSSFAVTPNESMKALKYFYYKLGNYLWGNYGFADAINLNTNPVWIGNQQLVYNQLPVMISIENYRSGLIWNLFGSCPEVKAGMKKLGFTAPYL